MAILKERRILRVKSLCRPKYEFPLRRRFHSEIRMPAACTRTDSCKMANWLIRLRLYREPLRIWHCNRKFSRPGYLKANITIIYQFDARKQRYGTTKTTSWEVRTIPHRYSDGLRVGRGPSIEEGINFYQPLKIVVRKRVLSWTYTMVLSINIEFNRW